VASEIEPQLGKNLADQAPASSATTAGVPHESAASNSWFAELKRRRVVRTLVGYGIASFAVLQIIEPVMHGLHWPETVLSYVVVALAAGFPVIITLAWIFDVKAGRIERTAPASAVGLRGIRLALLLVGIGVLAAAPGLIWYFFVRGVTRTAAVPAPATEVVTSSIAVLPFADMSPGKDQEYFADGIAEEILNALAQVKGLQVTGRTSSFSFKGKNEDLRSIGQKLGVGAVLEGSVRRSGSRVRVTAQVIKAADGFHLWSETYDRDLTDVFAVQEEIARAVVTTLKLKLLPQQAPSTKKHHTDKPEVYAQFLLGNAFARHGSPEGYRKAVTAYQGALALDPDYAPAWAALARSLRFLSSTDEALTTNFVRERQHRAEAVERALALAPDLAEAYTIRGEQRLDAWNWAGAQSDFERAHSLNPGESLNQALRGALLANLGRLDDAIATEQRQTEIDPLAAHSWFWLGCYLNASGRLEQARAAIERSLQIDPEDVYALRELGFNHLLAGRPADALAIFERSPISYVRDTGVAMAQHSLGHLKESQQALDALVSRDAHRSAWQVAQIHAWRGDRESAFEWLERAFATHDPGLRYVKYDPFVRNLRRDPRYTALLKKMNLPLD